MQERRAQWLRDHALHEAQREAREARWCGCQFDHDDPEFLARASGHHQQQIPEAFRTPSIEARPLSVPAHADTGAHTHARTRGPARADARTREGPSEAYGLKHIERLKGVAKTNAA
jgi:hypothetical protein